MVRSEFDLHVLHNGNKYEDKGMEVSTDKTGMGYEASWHACARVAVVVFHNLPSLYPP